GYGRSSGAGRGGSSMPRTTFLLIALIALIRISWPGNSVDAAPAAKPTPAVQALLDRAAKEPAEKAPQTLDEAAKLADSTQDPAGGLAVARAISALGKSSSDRGDLSGAREHYQRALAIQEKLAPASLDVAGSLSGLGIVADAQGNLAGAREYHQRALAI